MHRPLVEEEIKTQRRSKAANTKRTTGRSTLARTLRRCALSLRIAHAGHVFFADEETDFFGATLSCLPNGLTGAVKALG